MWIKLMYLSELFRVSLLERHEHIVEALYPYKDQSDIFITFSDITKVGLNPNTGWDTPAGVYTYPIVQMWDKIVSDDIPFGKSRAFVHVLKADMNLLTKMTEYTEGEYEYDLVNIKKLYFQNANVKRLDKLLAFNQHRIFPSSSIGRGGYEKLTQKQKEKVINYEIRTWAQESKLQTPIGFFWSVTRNLAIEITKTSGRKMTSVWNYILRSLGYDAFVDDAGIGLIHENEVYQAVFLTNKSYQHVATFNNIRKKTVNIVKNCNELMELITNGDFDARQVCRAIRGLSGNIRIVKGFWNNIDKSVLLKIIELTNADCGMDTILGVGYFLSNKLNDNDYVNASIKKVLSFKFKVSQVLISIASFTKEFKQNRYLVTKALYKFFELLPSGIASRWNFNNLSSNDVESLVSMIVGNNTEIYDVISQERIVKILQGKS